MLAASLLALALTSSAAPGAAATLSPPVVLIEGGRFHGSGIVWGPGRVLTALHVVEDMPAVTVALPGDAPHPARVVDRDAWLDLALLAVDLDLGAALPLGASAVLAPGDRVALSGCPARSCAGEAGRVLEASRAFAGARYLSLAAAVRPGASGGPVVDGRGALVGVVDLALVREGAVALAIPIERAAARFPRTATPSP